MRKKDFIFSIILFFALFILTNTIYAFNKNGGNLRNNYEWSDKSFEPRLYLQPYFNFNGAEFVKFKTFNCSTPEDLEVKNITDTSATIKWKDDVGTSWEYIVISTDAVLPANGIVTSLEE